MVTRTGQTIIVGVFEDPSAAGRAVDELERAGFREDQIGFARRDGEASRGGTGLAEGGTQAGEGASAGALTGGVVGGLIGAAAAGLIPGIGPVLAGGILASTLGGAAFGAAAGGLLGALTGMGVPEEDARYYEDELQSGRTLVTVTGDGRLSEANAILRRYGAYDVETQGGRGPAVDHATPGTVGRPARMRQDVAPRREPAAPVRRENGATIELREEELVARKERVRTGEVDVHKEVAAEEKTLEVPIVREQVVVEHHPVAPRLSDRPITQGHVIEVPVHEEAVSIEKQAVVYEELSIGKREVRETERVSDTLRREIAEIETVGDAEIGGWVEASASYRRGWAGRAGDSGRGWEDVEPGYRYGHEMARDPRYRGRRWADVETRLRSDYAGWAERQGYRREQGGWERLRDSVREAWEEILADSPARRGSSS